MDFKKLEQALNAPVEDAIKRKRVIAVLAEDKNAIPDLLDLLAQERQNNKDLITDMNSELSRAHIFIDELNPALLGKKEKLTNLGEQVTKPFIMDEIAKFYIKYKGMVTHCYNRFKD